MKQERVQRKAVRPRDRSPEVLPLSVREIFYPYPIRKTSEPHTHRSR